MFMLCAALPVLAVMNPNPHMVSIDADYAIGTAFEDTFTALERIETTAAAGTATKTISDSGTIRISRLPDDGRFLVSRAIGSYVERTQDRSGTTSRRRTVNAKSEFDSLGYAKERSGDPAELVPIFPGRPVGVGAIWNVSSSVRSAYGGGVAHYTYRVASIRRAPNGHTLATLGMRLRAALNRNSASLSGSGTIVWDCTVHQRTFSTTTLVYRARLNGRVVFDSQYEEDSLRLMH